MRSTLLVFPCALLACASQKELKSISLDAIDQTRLDSATEGQVVGVGSSGLRITTAAGDPITVAADGSFTLPPGTSPEDLVIIVPESDPTLACTLDASTSPWTITCQVARASVSGTISGLAAGISATLTVTAGSKSTSVSVSGAYTVEVEAYKTITVSITPPDGYTCAMADARNGSCEANACVGDCTGKACGEDDGCGVSCGECPTTCGSITSGGTTFDSTNIDPWQTFTAPETKTIAALTVHPNLYDAADTAIDFRLRIYAGEGVGGTVLAEQAFTNIAYAPDFPATRFAFTTPPNVTNGQVYTWEVVRTDGNQLGLRYAEDGNYAGGHVSATYPSAATWDFEFSIELSCP